MKFNYEGPRSFGARGYWSATQESLRSTALSNSSAINNSDDTLINVFF